MDTRSRWRARHRFKPLKACQAERDYLRKQSSGDARVKEFLDAQLSRLENQARRLHHENGDLRTQCAADAKMKEYLAREWESVRADMESLREKLVAVTRQRDDMMVQTRADQRVKEYLSKELERYEHGSAERRNLKDDMINFLYLLPEETKKRWVHLLCTWTVSWFLRPTLPNRGAHCAGVFSGSSRRDPHDQRTTSATEKFE